VGGDRLPCEGGFGTIGDDGASPVCRCADLARQSRAAGGIGHGQGQRTIGAQDSECRAGETGVAHTFYDIPMLLMPLRPRIGLIDKLQVIKSEKAEEKGFDGKAFEAETRHDKTSAHCDRPMRNRMSLYNYRLQVSQSFRWLLNLRLTQQKRAASLRPLSR
jgi:hypothetical protein